LLLGGSWAGWGFEFLTFGVIAVGGEKFDLLFWIDGWGSFRSGFKIAFIFEYEYEK
jgi:hypothetical protein